MKILDLFCGAGGASLGLHRAGLDVHGYDHWPTAVDCHNANGLPATILDLSIDDPPHPGEPFWMWASPPCQPFSAAGTGAGEFDGRDGFPWLLRIVGRLLPEVLFAENVKGLTFEAHRAYFAGVIAALRAFGYDVDWRVLNCADLGVPQTRERCIIVARRDGLPVAWPTPTHTEHEGLFTRRWVTMAEALGWDGELAYRRGEGLIERHGARGPWDTTAIPAPTVHRNSEKDWIVKLDRRQTGAPVIDCHDTPAPTVTAAAVGAGVWKLWAEERPATTINGDPRVSGRHDPNVSGSQQADAIRLTIPELAALQGFPADWRWTGTKTQNAKMIGNAVPPALAEAVVSANLAVAVAS